MERLTPDGVTTVVLSGMHSGPNPSPGLGTARSLKAAFPDVRLIGLDYSNQSSGLHSPLLDDIVCMPSWSEIELDVWVDQLRKLVDNENVYMVSGLDLETRLLSASLSDVPGLLVPGSDALGQAVKPPVDAARSLGLGYAAAEHDHAWGAVDRFVRRSPSGVWVKGRHYEAFRAHSAAEALTLGRGLEERWGDDWHLEAHLDGEECGLAFCARDGRLLGAVLMEKSQLTVDGKTWSGHVRRLDGELRSRLSAWVEANRWTGGAELELVRHWDGTLSLMELNPRLPAWIHGATVLGFNLPAALLSGEPDRVSIAEPDARTGRPAADAFTRVVEEIPVSPNLGIPQFPWPTSAVLPAAGKHPSGMPQLALRQARGELKASRPRRRVSTGGELTAVDWPHLAETAPETPGRILRPEALAKRIDLLRGELATVTPVTLAYSIKTNPDPELLAVANAAGLIAEAITLDELDAAARAGFTASDAILNGPAKWWPLRDDVVAGTAFVDSVGELHQVLRRVRAGWRPDLARFGMRVAPVQTASRFGIPLHEPQVLREVFELLSEVLDTLDASWGLSFHHAASMLGSHRWRRESYAALSALGPLTAVIGRPAAVVDLGGGWHFDDLAEVAPSLRWVVERLALVDDTELVIEPGKLLVEDAGFVVTEVLVVDRTADAARAVVDAGAGDVPEGAFWRHPVAVRRKGGWFLLPDGGDVLLGRSCMERDVIANGVSLSEVREGDILMVGMCGAYDTSMAYQFGRGQHG